MHNLCKIHNMVFKCIILLEQVCTKMQKLAMKLQIQYPRARKSKQIAFCLCTIHFDTHIIAKRYCHNRGEPNSTQVGITNHTTTPGLIPI